MRYIERELDLRRQLGKAVAIIGISAGLSALTACGNKAKSVDSVSEKESRLADVKEVVGKTPRTVDGDVAYSSPVDTAIIDKDPATIKKRTAPFQQSVPKTEKKDSAVCAEDEEVIGRVGAVEPAPMPNPSPYIAPPPSERIYGVVEQMPSFPGGQKKMMEYLAKNTQYPEECKDSGVQGRVIVSFVVEKDGSISGVKVVKGLHPLLDYEAMRVVSFMPKWIPGKQNGVPYRVEYIIPVTFRPQ